MFLQGVIRLVVVCFLAIRIRTVRAEPIMSLSPDDANVIFSPAERRRWGLFKKFKRAVRRGVRKVGRGFKRGVRTVRRGFRWVKRWYTKTHPRRLRKCKKRCFRTSAFCGVGYTKCLKKCFLRCYAMHVVRKYKLVRIFRG